MKYTPIDSSLYVKNRQRFASKMASGSLAIFFGNDEMPMTGDQNYDFVQNRDLLHLSGIDQEQTTLILFPDCPDPKFKEVLFLRKTSAVIAVWEGHKYTFEEAKQASGIQTILWNDDLEAIQSMLMNWAQSVYLNGNENDRFNSSVEYRDQRMGNALKARYTGHRFDRAQPIMKELRAIKQELEIEQIQHACDITEKALRRVLAFVKPGVTEYQVEAEITHEFLMNRATGHAYHPIVASGGNACVLHYIDNNKECLDGDILLMDFGSEYANYASDLTRTIPVSGKFSDRQKAVYNAVLEVMKAATKLLVPGGLLDDYHKAVGVFMEEQLIGLGLLDKDEVKKQDPNNPLYKKYFMHGTSHHLGLDVHDLAYRHMPFQEGMVLTCEPGIYIPNEKIGIRIENDILITASGPRDLMANIPIEANDIEDQMNA